MADQPTLQPNIVKPDTRNLESPVNVEEFNLEQARQGAELRLERINLDLERMTKDRSDTMDRIRTVREERDALARFVKASSSKPKASKKAAG